MFLKSSDCYIRIVGVALEGRDGSPFVVFESPETGSLLTLPADPFDAEIIIREFIGEGDVSAVSWLGDLLHRSPPRRGRIDTETSDRPVVRFTLGGQGIRQDKILPFGEGLALCRRLDIPMVAADELFDSSREELSWLASSGTFMGDFLYLSPPQYAPGIPVE